MALIGGIWSTHKNGGEYTVIVDIKVRFEAFPQISVLSPQNEIFGSKVGIEFYKYGKQ